MQTTHFLTTALTVRSKLNKFEHVQWALNTGAKIMASGGIDGTLYREPLTLSTDNQTGY